MKTNNIFLKRFQIIILLFLLVFVGCINGKKEDNKEITTVEIEEAKPFFDLSLAEWSLHKRFNEEGVSPFEFARIADSLGFTTIEFVSQLYTNQIKELGFETVIDSLKKESEKYGLKNNLIMVDHEGDLADADLTIRNQAVENHKKWVDAAQKLGCQAVRVNTFGNNDPVIWAHTVVDGLKKLSEYAATKNINIICENHGWLSSDVPKLMAALDAVNMTNCGTLPDFGNWCIKRTEDKFGGTCVELYPDKYEGVKLMLPKAKGVSAKSYDFDENGNETTIDYAKMLQIVKDAGFSGIIGVEYEGERLSELEGVIATRELLFKVVQNLK